MMKDDELYPSEWKGFIYLVDGLLNTLFCLASNNQPV
jgi:hypothetical protein